MYNPIPEYNSFIKTVEGIGLFMYDKKIAYLHYIKNNGLMGNAGHAKIMYRGSSMSIEIFVRDMQMLPGGYYSLKGLGECKFEDKIHIERGQAVYKKRLDVDKTCKNKMPYGIRIEIDEKEYLEAVWQTEKPCESQIVAAERNISEKIPEIQQRNMEEENQKQALPKAFEKEKIAQEPRKDSEVCKEKDKNWDRNQLTFSVPLEMYEDKWKELCKKYDTVYPFGNGEAYISISPKDFIIFPEKYQNLVNNSFLLHGYYNYQHIILGKKEEGSKNVYYLGVPGVYYEREKMVAIMFGFEGFECGDKRASNGGFGYYMRRVEL